MGPSVHGNDLPLDEQRANARLAAAAFDVAEKAKEMGYDPQKAVEALPDLLADLQTLVSNGHHASCATMSYPNAPCSCGWENANNALARAEGSRDE